MAKSDDHLTALAGMALFAGLPKSALENLSKHINVIKLDADETVLHEMDASSDIYFLLSGIVTARSFSDDGQEVAFSRIEAPSIFGEFSAIDNQSRSADIKALTEIAYGRMSARDFQSLILAHPQFGLNLARHLVGKIRALSERVFEFGAFPVPVRVHRALLRLAKNGNTTAEGIVIRPAPSHYELSIMLSTHREAVSRELARLSRRGIIRTGRQAIVILKLPELRRAAGLAES